MEIFEPAQPALFRPVVGDCNHFQMFAGGETELPSKLCAGWEIRRQHSYQFHGQARTGPFGVIQYTVRGRGLLQCGDETYELLPGHAFLLESPGDYRYLLPASSPEWEFIFLTFNGDDALRHFRRIMVTAGPVVTLAHDDPVIKLLMNIGEILADQQFPTPEDAAHWLYHLMMLLRKNRSTPASLPSTALHLVLQYLSKHFAEPISCPDLAALATVSVTQLYRYFKAKTGYAPGQYVTLVRLQHALFLLQHTAMKLDEIGGKCGFGDGRYLRRVCNKVLGCAPTAFRHGRTPPPESCWRLKGIDGADSASSGSVKPK